MQFLWTLAQVKGWYFKGAVIHGTVVSLPFTGEIPVRDHWCLFHHKCLLFQYSVRVLWVSRSPCIIQKAKPVVPHSAEGLRRPNSSLVGNDGASPSPLFLRKVVRDVRSLEKPTWDGRMGENAPSSNRKWKRHTSYLGTASSLPYEDPNTIPFWGWGSEKIRIKKKTQPVPWEHEGHHCTQEAINKY